MTLIILIPLLPWFGAMWLFLGMMTKSRVGEEQERSTARIALTTVALSMLGMIGLDLLAWHQGPLGEEVWFTWFASGSFQVKISLLLDRPALVMGSLVAFTGFLTLRFSVNYLHRETGFHRFFAIMCLFIGGMEWIALAGHPVLTFVGWEAAGLSSYLLIGYAYDRLNAVSNATQAMVTNRFGDAGLLFGIAMTFILTGQGEWSRIFAVTQEFNSLLAGVTAAGFLLAALVKSAQFPFVNWINRALEGPTPSSAIFYGALMAHAGAFLLIRIEPILWRSPFWMGLLVVAGITTALFASLVGRVQTDVKSALIFSTQAQIGLIFAECGAGFFDLALWHLVAHTVWRLYQFLLSPSYIHLATTRPSPVPKWLAGNRTLYDLALNRFWLDSLADALFTRPTQALGQEVQIFDEKVVNRMAGRTVREGMMASQGEWGTPQTGSVEVSGFTQGRGVLGRLLEQSGLIFSWFEERLVTSSGGDGLMHGLTFFGGYLERVEQLLGQPRYLLLLIILTFVVIL